MRTKCGYLEGSVGNAGAFGRDIARVLGVFPDKYVGVPVADHIQQVGEVAPSPDTCEYVLLHVISVRARLTCGLYPLALTDDFRGLVNANGKKAKAIGNYIWADCWRGGEGHCVTFFLKSYSKGNQRMPVPRASLAGKEYSHVPL